MPIILHFFTRKITVEKLQLFYGITVIQNMWLEKNFLSRKYWLDFADNTEKNQDCKGKMRTSRKTTVITMLLQLWSMICKCKNTLKARHQEVEWGSLSAEAKASIMRAIHTRNEDKPKHVFSLALFRLTLAGHTLELGSPQLGSSMQKHAANMNANLACEHRARFDPSVHSVTAHFDGPTACTLCWVARRDCFPRLGVLSTL